MRRIYQFSSDGRKYILESNNPNDKREKFMIDTSDMQFDTGEFYEYVFRDMTLSTEIIINDLIVESEKKGKRVYKIINEICQGIKLKMDEQCFEE